MNKHFIRGMSMTLLTTTLVAVLPRNVKAMTCPLPTNQQQIVQHGVLKGVVILVSGIIMVNGAIIGCICHKSNVDTLQLKRIPRLPDTYTPNGVLEKIHPNTNEVIQRRFYDDKGKPALDIDLYDHNCPEYHPWPQHKHVWKDGVRGHQEPLTDAEYKYYIEDQNMTLMK